MTLNYVALTVTVQDAGEDAGTGAVLVAPTSAVTAAGVTVVSTLPVPRSLSSGSVTINLVATDNAGTTPAAGFWAYSVTLPGGQPQLYLADFANGASQRLDNLTPVVAKTTYGPAASSAGVTSFNTRTGAVAPQSGDYTAAQVGALAGSGGVPAADLAPKVTALTDGASIAVNAALGNDYWVTLGGNRTIAVPSNPTDGQKITFEIIQDGTGSRTVTWTSGAGGYAFGSGSAPVLSTTAAATDQVAFRYSARKNAWLYLGSTAGF